MIVATLYGQLLLGKREAPSAAPEPPPWRRFGLHDIGQNCKPPTKSRLNFLDADGMPMREFIKARVIDAVPDEYFAIKRRHEPNRLLRLAKQAAFLGSQFSHIAHSSSCARGPTMG